MAVQEYPFALGETIFQEGSAGCGFTWSWRGRCAILRRSSLGREVSVGVIGRGEVFGEYALLPPHRNTATCRAASPVRLLRLPLLPIKPILTIRFGTGVRLKNWLRLHGLLTYLREQTFLGFMSAPSALAHLDRLEPMEFAPCERSRRKVWVGPLVLHRERARLLASADRRDGRTAARTGTGRLLWGAGVGGVR